MKAVKTIIGLLVYLTIFWTPALAQQEAETARQQLVANAAEHKLAPADIEQSVVSSAYLSPTTGWYHVYFNQAVQGVEVYSRLMSAVLVGGQVRYATHNFIPNLSGLAVSSPVARKLTPLDALQKAVTDVGFPAANLAQLQELSAANLVGGAPTKLTYSVPTLSDEKVTVRLYWLPGEDKTKGTSQLETLNLVWNVTFLTKDGQNSWNIHVDANSGAILRKTDDVVHCDFGKPNHPAAPHVCRPAATDAQAFGLVKAKPLFAPNQYNVFDYPLEAPTFGGRTVVTSPYTRFVPAGTGPGATNGWHDNGTTSFTTTQGNNVWAQDDIDANNTGGSRPASATLDFNYPYTLGLGTAAANRDAAITNLFYWNNVIHDVLWKFGFDEPSGNFQTNNMGRGGAGNDHVQADAQDGSGTNNANFSTPADGGSGRMQMFLWNIPSTYQADSDFDNGIIAHEYGHGWSIRLTGGPSVVNCLQNAEQGGEGWSDYLGLMLTTNWASLSANVASANIPRGIGTYVLGQGTNGLGIRPYQYSYNMATVNGPVTYAQVGNTAFSQPHGIGSIWATMLWDMTWEIILQDNQIEANIHTTPASVSAMRGNIAALKLVNEGLKLQACSPSFVQARDAILQADQLLFAGRYRCSIARAFARRGLGANASTLGSSSDRLVSEQYTPITAPALSSSMSATICSGTVFAYTATSGTAGVTFSWSRSAVAGISNAAASAASGIISETLVNTTSDPIVVTYFVSLGGVTDPCGGAYVPQRVRVLVNPTLAPTVASYSVCQNGVVPVGSGLVSATGVTPLFSGSIATTAPTYVSPSGNNATVYAAGNTVRYQSVTFVAPSSGAYTFRITSAVLSNNDPDSYLALYQTAFNPASPATNFLRGDDDSGGGLLPQLTQTLTAGTTYILVASSYYANVSGTYVLQSSTSVFPVTPNWFAAASGGSSLASTTIFNPVGLAGSGIANTATPGTTTFFLANSLYPTCRRPATFTIQPTPTTPTATSSVTVASGASVTLTGTCSTTGSVLRWYRAADNVLVSMPVSPTATTGFYARCESPNSTTAPCISPQSSVTVTVLSLTSYESVTSGNWNVPSTWNCNCIPNGTLPVQIMNTHTVTVPNAYTGQAQQLKFIGNGKLTTQGTGKVNVIN